MADERTVQERDLYRRLLELGHTQDLEALLAGALDLALHATGASQGYLAVYPDRDPAQSPAWWCASGFSEAQLDEVREAFSTGVIRHALEHGDVVHTVSAMHDPRFADRASVRRRRIDAVLCAPLEDRQGVLYLQGRAAGGPFTDADVDLVRLFAQHLSPSVRHALLRHRVDPGPDPTAPWRERLEADGLIGRSRALADVLEKVHRIANFDVGVLLTGPSGAGKSALARVIWKSSRRRGYPFVELNCSTVTESLMVAELFGADRGSYTGADHVRAGRIAEADRGVLFLDEVAELPANAQAALLTFLDSGQYTRLGEGRVRHADVRVIAATNVDLEQAVDEGRFREDLYHRLHAYPIRLPPLEERREDIELLARHLCAAFCRREPSLPPMRLALSTIEALEGMAWPGNVRQLAHKVTMGIIAANPDTVVRPHHLEPSRDHAGDDVGDDLAAATARFQRQHVARVLAAHDGHRTAAATALGIARSYLYTLIARFKLE